MEKNLACLKKADLASSVGAGILGVGLGVLFAKYLKSFAVPTLILGLLLHGWGMFEKRRMVNEPESRSLWWSELLYWGCWVALLLLAGYIALSVLTS